MDRFFSSDEANTMIDDVTSIMNNLYEKSNNDERKNMLGFFRDWLQLEMEFWNEVYYKAGSNL
jgi:thiaminase